MIMKYMLRIPSGNIRRITENDTDPKKVAI